MTITRWITLLNGGLGAIAVFSMFAHPLFAQTGTRANVKISLVSTTVADDAGTPDRFDATNQTAVESAEFSPDGTRVATVAKGDESVRLWDVSVPQRPKLLWKQDGEDETESVTFTRDGRFVITGGEVVGVTIRVWRADNGTPVRTLPDVASVEGLRVSPDGRWLATGNEAGQIKLWDVSDADPAQWPGRPAHTLVQGPDRHAPHAAPGEERDADVNQIDWTADSRRLFTAGRNGMVKQWALDGRAPRLVRAYADGQASVKSVRLSPDERLVAAGAGGRTGGRVWDVASGDLVAAFVEPAFVTPANVETVAFTRDGRFLLLGGTWPYDDVRVPIRVYRVADLRAGADAEPVASLDAWRQEYLHFTHGGRLLVSSHDDGTFRLWRVEVTP